MVYSTCRMQLMVLFASALMLLLLSGCVGESGGGSQKEETNDTTQADDSDTIRLSDDNIQAMNDLIAQEMQDKNLPGVVVGVGSQ